MNLLAYVGGGTAIFLVGANVAFLGNLGTSLTRWFTFKVLAVTLLLVYVALSLLLGSPDAWRVPFALGGLGIDVLALLWMWKSIEDAAKSGEVGLVPLMLPRDPED